MHALPFTGRMTLAGFFYPQTSWSIGFFICQVGVKVLPHPAPGAAAAPARWARPGAGAAPPSLPARGGREDTGAVRYPFPVAAAMPSASPWLLRSSEPSF